MSEYSTFFHYGTIACVVGITSIGVGIGEGLSSMTALKAINIQPSAKDEIAKTVVLGMALIETAAIMGVTIAMMLLLQPQDTHASFYAGLSEIGIALALCLSGFVLGLVSCLPVREACLAIARQPFFGQKIIRFMLITQSIIQTPIIFGFIIAIFIKDQAWQSATLADSLRLVGSGLAIGLGSVGPAIGLALFAQTACRGIGINRNAYNKLLTFSFISEAIIETPIIFAMVVSLLLMAAKIPGENLLAGIGYLAAGLCIGLGTLGPGISSGRTASAACQQIAFNPEQHPILSKVSMFAQGLIDTSAIYALLIALALLLFR